MKARFCTEFNNIQCKTTINSKFDFLTIFYHMWMAIHGCVDIKFRENIVFNYVFDVLYLYFYVFDYVFESILYSIVDSMAFVS